LSAEAAPNAPPNTASNVPPMSRLKETILVGYFIVLLILFIYTLVSIWTPSGSTGLSTLFIFSYSFSFSPEARLILIAAFAGGLGGAVHAISSLVAYHGAGKLTEPWAWWYFARPVIGTSLALIVYFAVRGGLLTVSSDATGINQFGIAALAGITGMFTEHATRKLRDALDSLFGLTKSEKA